MRPRTRLKYGEFIKHLHKVEHVQDVYKECRRHAVSNEIILVLRKLQAITDGRDARWIGSEPNDGFINRVLDGILEYREAHHLAKKKEAEQKKFAEQQMDKHAGQLEDVPTKEPTVEQAIKVLKGTGKYRIYKLTEMEV